MKRAVAVTKCEVAGKEYSPGEEMSLTEGQLASLVSRGAAKEVVSAIGHAPSLVIQPVGTIAPPVSGKVGKLFGRKVKRKEK